ncbi:hypothetical protein PQX77_012521 [Marasmius sp. AFHP31]|nr:hypothetical protein PQX77_012521 [Marasmius sp. AFHP31]
MEREVDATPMVWQSLDCDRDLVNSGAHLPDSEGTAAGLWHVPRSILNTPIVDFSPPFPQPFSPTLPADLPQNPEINMGFLPDYIPFRYNTWIQANDGRSHQLNPVSSAGISSADYFNDHEHLLFPSSHFRAVFETAPTLASSHSRTPPSGNTGSRQVGSLAGTEAARARRGPGSPRYFCGFPGCTSRGFTAKHNYKCPSFCVDAAARSAHIQTTRLQITFAPTMGKGLSDVPDAEPPFSLATTSNDTDERIEKSPVNPTRR